MERNLTKCEARILIRAIEASESDLREVFSKDDYMILTSAILKLEEVK